MTLLLRVLKDSRYDFDQKKNYPEILHSYPPRGTTSDRPQPLPPPKLSNLLFNSYDNVGRYILLVTDNVIKYTKHKYFDNLEHIVLYGFMEHFVPDVNIF
jgi:hypothetical protein